MNQYKFKASLGLHRETPSLKHKQKQKTARKEKEPSEEFLLTFPSLLYIPSTKRMVREKSHRAVRPEV